MVKKNIAKLCTLHKIKYTGKERMLLNIKNEIRKNKIKNEQVWNSNVK